MKFQIASVMLALLLATPVQGQDAGPDKTDQNNGAAQRLSGYVFAAPGVFQEEFTYDVGFPHGGYEIRRRTFIAGHVGGGLDWRFYKSLGLSVEGGAVTLDGYPTGSLSLNGAYWFLTGNDERRPIMPFITGGYSRISTLNGLNAGAGVDYWVRQRWGLKFEIRAYRLNDQPQYDFRGHPLLSEFRIGLNFR
jgi:hypothetical protein